MKMPIKANNPFTVQLLGPIIPGDSTVLRHHTNPPPVLKRVDPYALPAIYNQCCHVQPEESANPNAPNGVETVYKRCTNLCVTNAPHGWLCAVHEPFTNQLIKPRRFSNETQDLQIQLDREVSAARYNGARSAVQLDYKRYAQYRWATKVEERVEFTED